MKKFPVKHPITLNKGFQMRFLSRLVGLSLAFALVSCGNNEKSPATKPLTTPKSEEAAPAITKCSGDFEKKYSQILLDVTHASKQLGFAKTHSERGHGTHLFEMERDELKWLKQSAREAKTECHTFIRDNGGLNFVCFGEDKNLWTLESLAKRCAEL